MRIVHVVPSYLPAVRYGGPIVAVHGLCRALAARGHAVDVFTTSIDGPTNSAVPHNVPVDVDGVKVRYFPSPFMRRLYFAPALVPALRRELKQTDVVHLHSVFLWPTWAAARLCRSAQVPYLASPRGMLVKSLIKARNRLVKSAWIALIERSNLENASALHVTSAVEAAELTKFGWRLRRTVTIPNGVDDIDGGLAGEPADEIKRLLDRQPLILFLGRLSWVKALERLLHAFAQTRVGTLAIVGTDEDGLAPRLTQLVRDLNLAERVCVVARTVTGIDKEALLAAAKVFVLASYSESFGNAVLEAMQRGLPVIATQQVGASEVVRAAGGGIVVEGEVAAIGQAIARLAESPELARSMGEAGRRHVHEHYGWDSVAARMEALYESVTC
jgi:glycosyltransferase involved in cell wall biosynthesis